MDTPALTDAQIEELERLLQTVPAALDPLDTSGLDGFLCGVLLQPRRVADAQWLRWITDADGRPLPEGFDSHRLHALARRRHAELDHAIEHRTWFDPWIYEVDDAALTASESMQPWVAGFSLATDHFTDLLALRDPGMQEPLAVLYACFDPQDLEDVDDLLPLIETLEPPADLSHAAEDVVRSVLLLADVARPRPPQRPAGRAGVRRKDPERVRTDRGGRHRG